GMAGGVILARRASVAQPRPRGIVAVVGATMIFAAAAVLPLRGTTDVRPEIERLASLEVQIAQEYDGAVDRFGKGRMSAKALADVIQHSILPKIAAARTRVDGMHKVPESQQPLLTTARLYLRLCDDHRRLRA